MEQFEGLNNLKMCKEHTEFVQGLDHFIHNDNINDNLNELKRYDWKFLAKQFRIELKDTIINSKTN